MWDAMIHLVDFRNKLQAHVIRILFMVPVYSIECWCALRYKEAAIYLELGRASYEAYVIYTFLHLLLGFSDVDGALQQRLAETNVEAHHIAPFKCARVCVYTCVVVCIRVGVHVRACVRAGGRGGRRIVTSYRGGPGGSCRDGRAPT